MIQKVAENYLFDEIDRRCQGRQNLLRLGVGDTTEPLPPVVAEAMAKAARDLATREHYTGYGPIAGHKALREAIAERFDLLPDEVFISDGAKCDFARLLLLKRGGRALVQDPVYPINLDAARIAGYTAHLLPCTPENGFFPSELPPADLLILCNPVNPTGTSATREQLQQAVEWARQSGALIIVDAVYNHFIQDPAIPRSIYEIPGADEVAIELNSFSKLAGFTGVRLGWTVVPKGLPLRRDWERLNATLYNGTCSIAQAGGLAALKEGWGEVQNLVAHYMENAKILRRALPKAYGGENAPYLWLPCHDSWGTFDRLLDQGVVVTPGVGFGPHGEHFIRVSAFGSRATIEAGAQRLSNYCVFI
ncbi:MAG: LL-diaminopimelate aminotransferase [Parachlamydiales bacterium]